ncbi:NAD-dependent epimerase/dehydratase family protein [Streptomyces sp. DSM 40750]|uniref:NAD-dependent epimerase/dehydratase family protein n=1 Tax=Streptomyces sp. DSM 40750 TaxID=2801030 RepID=UPI00214ADD6C|nr:NAD-dependent epimerase/dehydratase family protein [Streptomyces sp. DSM 40750]UUU23961.1 NAD-dependent epimerase/dehydratase family protein [Streptomyces sp. DSM 40750]
MSDTPPPADPVGAGSSGGPRSVLVTGATGLLGSAVVERLLADGAEVTAVVRNAARARDLLPDHPALRLVTGDVTDIPTYAGALRGMDAVIHTAAYFREYYQPGHDLELLHRTNVTAVEELLRAAVDASVPTVVHTSSIAVLSRGDVRSPGDEDTPNGAATQDNHYRASKIRAERVIRDFEDGLRARFGAEYGLRVPLVLPGWMWGPGDAGPTSAGRLFLAVAHGGIKALPTAGNHVVDARDVAAVCVAAAERGVAGRRYIAGGSWYPLHDICSEVVRATGTGAVPRRLPAHTAMALASVLEWQAKVRRKEPVATRTGMRVLLEGDRRRVSSARAVRELDIGFRPLEQTIADQAAWHRARRQLPAAEQGTRIA